MSSKGELLSNVNPVCWNLKVMAASLKPLFQEVIMDMNY